MAGEYVRLEGSERRPAASSVLIGPADASEWLEVKLVLRRRTDGPPMPDHDFFIKTPLNKRQRRSMDEFAAQYGADPSELDQVAAFVREAGLTLVKIHAARRTVVAAGTVTLMNDAFGVSLGRYRYGTAPAPGEIPRPETYRGRDGFIHVPANIAAFIIGVFGLDNRRISGRNGTGDPPVTLQLTIATITSLYHFPGNAAAGENIAIYAQEGGGYLTSDIQNFLGGTMPAIIDVNVDASNGTTPDLETTLDIAVSAAVAKGATIVPYWTTDTQSGWFDMISRVVHPDPGDPVCSVLSNSYWVSKGDEPALILDYGISLAWVMAVTMGFQDAALQGVTVCIASGDSGTDSGVSDGKAHVQYPGSDPWVLSCGGTTVGDVNGQIFDEYVWNDNFGATGGGVSGYFSLPDYQQSANVPVSMNGNMPGRGVPDVAGNASGNSGYPITVGGIGNTARGTSAVAPLYAGLMAVLNAQLGIRVGFLNPLLYQLGGSVCRDVNPLSSNPPAGPTDNGTNGVAGYPAGPGWDACTGWGSINGVALLTALQQAIQKDCYLILDWSSFLKSGVDEMIAQSTTHEALFQNAFYLVVDWFTAADLGIGTASPVKPQISFPNPMPSGLSIQQVGVAQQDAFTPSRWTYTYQITFKDDSAFPVPPQEIETLTLTASVTGIQSNVTVHSSAPIELTTQSGPFMVAGSLSWLSDDIRVFQIEAGNTLAFYPYLQMGNTGDPVNDATTFIQGVIKGFNLEAWVTPPNHPFDTISTSETTSQLDILQDDSNTQLPVYNFAVARIRYQDPEADAQNVRVFFRTFPALAISTAYDQTTTYRRWSDGVEFGTTIPLLGGQFDTALNMQLETIPFFAQPRIDASLVSMTTQTDEWNVQTIVHDPGDAVVYAYYGCWLDLNQLAPVLPQVPVGDGPFAGPLVPILSLLANQHQCITAEISYDPIPIPPGATPGSGAQSMLGQRNLNLVPAANPGQTASRTVSTPFEMKSTPADLPAGALPDELMIDWGNTPKGSAATLYLPDADATGILQEAIRLYGGQHLELADAHTLRFPTGGISYLPIPRNDDVNLACLLSVNLPAGIREGEVFRIDLRQLTTAAASGRTIGGQKPGTGWRRVLGTVRMTIPVSKKALMLAPEERLFTVLRRILHEKTKTGRWYPVFLRYAEAVAERVRALGGDPDRPDGCDPDREC